MLAGQPPYEVSIHRALQEALGYDEAQASPGDFLDRSKAVM
jgi:hypothetical protein